MDLVYNWIPSGWDELYYSVRSMKRYYKDLNKIYVLTLYDLPFEDEQVIRVPIVEIDDIVENKLIDNVRQFCELELCDEFIYLADDHFALKPFDRDDLVPTYLEDIKDVAYWSEKLPYWNRLLYTTMTALQEHGYPTLNYASHSAEIFECKRFVEMCEKFQGHRVQIQSAYLNMFATTRQKLSENPNHNKVFDSHQKYIAIDILTRNNTFFCCSDKGLNDDMKQFIQEKFT